MAEDVNGCRIDPGRLTPLRPCMECCGPESPRDEWNHSCIHPRTVAYSCGRLAYPGGSNAHDHDPEEVVRCRSLADEAARILVGVKVNASEGSSTLDPFFVTANRGHVLAEPTPDAIRAAFGGTIYPAAPIFVGPLREGGRGWDEIAVEADDSERLPPAAREFFKHVLENERRDRQRRLEHWRALLAWFKSKRELRCGSFVIIGEDRLSKQNFGCVFPRLILGLTRLGSLVGVCGHAVHT